MSKFGDFLYELRKEKGMTQAELADRLGITNKAVSKWETGEAFPETSMLVPLSNIFSVTVDELLKGERITSSEGVGRPDDRLPALKPMTKPEALGIASAIALFLVGALALIILMLKEVDYQIAVPVMLACVSTAVFTLVFVSAKRSLRSADMEKADYNKGIKYSLMRAFGVALTIIAAATLVGLVEKSLVAALCVFFGLLICGIFLLVFSGILWDEFNKKYRLPEDEVEKSVRAKKLEETVSGAIMIIATGVFFILGFGFGKWHPGLGCLPDRRSAVRPCVGHN